jgi:hypothetical protein
MTLLIGTNLIKLGLAPSYYRCNFHALKSLLTDA